MFRRHVLIIRWSKLHYTTSGIITPISLMIPDDEHMCWKHAEAWNKLIVKQKFCSSSWLITEINNKFIFSLYEHFICFSPVSLHLTVFPFCGWLGQCVLLQTHFFFQFCVIRLFLKLLLRFSCDLISYGIMTYCVMLSVSSLKAHPYLFTVWRPFFLSLITQFLFLHLPTSIFALCN